MGLYVIFQNLSIFNSKKKLWAKKVIFCDFLKK